MRKQDAAFCTNGSLLTPTDCRTETEMGPIVLSGRDISNLLPKVARTGRELLGIAFVKPAAKNLGLKPFIPSCFCNICCLSWRNDIWFEMCFLGDGDFAHGGSWGKCSRKEFDLVYQRLNIQGLQERNALWLGMASVGLTGNCTQHIQKWFDLLWSTFAVLRTKRGFPTTSSFNCRVVTKKKIRSVRGVRICCDIACSCIESAGYHWIVRQVPFQQGARRVLLQQHAARCGGGFAEASRMKS